MIKFKIFLIYREGGEKMYERRRDIICKNISLYQKEVRFKSIVNKYDLYCPKNGNDENFRPVLFTEGVILVLSGLISFVLIRFSDSYGRSFISKISSILACLGFLLASFMNGFWFLVVGISIGYSGITTMFFISFLILNESLCNLFS